MLRTHFFQQWFTLPYSGIEVTLSDVTLYREVAQIQKL